jgi:hypothetical protein
MCWPKAEGNNQIKILCQKFLFHKFKVFITLKVRKIVSKPNFELLTKFYCFLHFYVFFVASDFIGFLHEVHETTNYMEQNTT